MPDEPKAPVTYQDVVEAVDTFLEEGRTRGEITARLIRSKVGDRGSLGTVLKHRDKYFAALDEPKAESFVNDDDLAVIRNVLNNIVARQIDADRAQADFERDATQAEVRALQAKVTDLEDIAAENEDRWKEAQAVADAVQVTQSKLELRAVEAEAALNEARRANEALAGMVERLLKQSEIDQSSAASVHRDGPDEVADTAKDGRSAGLTPAGRDVRAGDGVESPVDNFDDAAVFPMDVARNPNASEIDYDAAVFPLDEAEYHDAFEVDKDTKPD